MLTPKKIHIETTNFCNAQCEMCPNRLIKRKKGHMAWELYKKIIDQFEEFEEFEDKGLNIALHLEGEPLLDPLLVKRISYLKFKLKKSKVYFHTNAMLLDFKMSKELLNTPLDRISFSVDGSTKKTYESIRKGLNYERVVENIETFLSLKGSMNINLHTTIQMVTNNVNAHEIVIFKSLWGNKVDQINIKKMHNFLDAGKSIVTKELSRYQKRKCFHPFYMLIIYQTGEVGLCCWDYDNFFRIGNVNEYSILGLYNNKACKKLRDSMNKLDCVDINPCNRCSKIYGDDIYY